MRTEKRLLDKKALRTIKGGWGFTLTSGTSSPWTSSDESGDDGTTPTDGDIPVDSNRPSAMPPPPGVFKGFTGR